MLDFRCITPEILKEYKKHIVPNGIRLCDYAPGCLALWGEYPPTRICVHENMLFALIETRPNTFSYMLPVGNGNLNAAFDTIEADAAKRGIPISFCCIPKEYVDTIKERFPKLNAISYESKWSDYLYPYANFCGYHGNALHGQRNHVNRFTREHPNYTFLPITGENIDRAERFMIENRPAFDKDEESAEEELSNLYKIFEAYDVLNLSGGYLIDDGRVLGITIGEAIGDTLHVHVEKALTRFTGAYQVLAMCFAEYMKSDELVYINRQDDSGDEGLRRSKETYKPCAMLEKYKMDIS